MDQATSSDSRGPGKTQLLPHPIKSSSSLSTKARIATNMAKGPLSFVQSKTKYQGLSMRKNTNPPGESRSPVTRPTTNPQSPVESPQQPLLLRSSSEHNNQDNQVQSKKPSQSQPSPPPPPPQTQPEEPFHDPEPDPVDVDQSKFVDFLSRCYFSNRLQVARPLHRPDRRIL